MVISLLEIDDFFIIIDLCVNYFPIDPHAILHFSTWVIKTAYAVSFIILPLANVVRTVAPYEPTIAMFDVSFEHAFVNIAAWENLSTHTIYLGVVFVNFLAEEILYNGTETGILKNRTLILC